MLSRTILAIVILFLSFTPGATAQENLPVIATAKANLQTGVLTLTGENFGPAPVVRMGASSGMLQELVIVSATDTSIQADLATTAAGTYLVVVRRDPKKQPNHVAFIDLTIGATGVQGPQGERGPQGEQGPIGPQGPAGEDGKDGADGADGSDGIDGRDGVDGKDGKDGGEDPITKLATRLGAERARVAVPVEALRPLNCGGGDRATLFIEGIETGQVAGVIAREAINEVNEYHVLLRGAASLGSDDFVGAAARLQIAAAGGALNPNGVITGFARLSSDGAGSLYIVAVEPRIAFGKHDNGFETHIERSAGEILQAGFAGLQVSASVALERQYQSGYEVRWNETSIQFLQRLMEEEGIFYFSTDDGGVTVSDSNSVFAEGPTLPYLGPFADPGSNPATISSLSLGGRAATSRTTVRSWNYFTKETVQGMSSSDSAFPESITLDLLAGTIQSATEGARVRQERARVEANQRQGTSNSPGIRAGSTLNVQGAGAGFSGSFYVTSVQHVLHPEENGCFAYGNSFTAVPSSFVFRPARVTPRPRVPGLITAEVINRSDPEQLGRVKVMFPGFVESDWARVTFALWQSPGAAVLPDIGDEVLVAFVGGDLRNPVVIGGLYNGDDRPPTIN